MNKYILLLFIGLLSLISCNRQLSLSPSNKKNKLDVVDAQFEYLTAKAKFTYNYNGKKVSATANFRIKQDSIIWVSISRFGLEGVRAIIDENKVEMVDRLKKKYYNYPFSEVSKAYNFDFNFQLIQSLILGNLPEPYKNQKIKEEANYLTYTTSKKAYLFHNYFGKNSKKLEKIRVLDKKTKNIILINYTNFIEINKQTFPSEVSIVINDETSKNTNAKISISYSKMEIKNNPISFPYSIPKNYEKK